jgi:hypothetical protein
MTDNARQQGAMASRFGAGERLTIQRPGGELSLARDGRGARALMEDRITLSAEVAQRSCRER